MSLGSGSPTGGAATSIALTTLQGLAPASWITDASNNMYTRTPTVTIVGTCTRGISTISATVSAVTVPETATCGSDGTFTWSKVFTSSNPATGTTYPIVLQALDTDGNAISGATISQSVLVDNTAPSTPVPDAAVTSNGSTCSLNSGVYDCTGATGTYTLTGTKSADSETMAVSVIPTTQSQGTLTITSSTTYSFTSTITEGAQVTVTFTGSDHAQNVSASSTPVQVAFLPVTQLLGGSTIGGGSSSGTSPFSGTTGNPTMIGSVSPLAGVFVDTVSAAATDSVKAQMHLGPVAVGARQLNQ